MIKYKIPDLSNLLNFTTHTSKYSVFFDKFVDVYSTILNCDIPNKKMYGKTTNKLTNK